MPTLEQRTTSLEASTRTLASNQTEMASNQEQIIIILQGELEPDFIGGPAVRNGGLVSDVHSIKTRIENGGINMRLPVWTKWAAFVLTVVNIIVGVSLVASALG